MTENEAKFLEKLDELASDLEVDMYSVANLNFFFEESANTIRKLIEEVQQYRAIGTVEEIENSFKKTINAFEKANPLIESALDILAEYQSIGTIDEFKALKEKNTPKKPFGGMYDWTCPTCGTYHSTHGKCCSECMQMILWD